MRTSLVAACLSMLAAGIVPAVEIRDFDIQNDSYTFTVTAGQLGDNEFVTELLSESTDLTARDEGQGVCYVTPNPSAVRAELKLTFDFSQSSYEVESVSLRESFNFFVRPDQPSDAVVKAGLSWAGGRSEDLWSVVCGAQSRHEKPFESQVEIGGARQVEYKLTMEVLSDDALGSFGDAAYQWNRLSSPEDDESRAFRIVFKLRKIK